MEVLSIVLLVIVWVIAAGFIGLILKYGFKMENPWFLVIFSGVASGILLFIGIAKILTDAF